MIWEGAPFGGAKIAAMLGDALLVYRRDNKTEIPFPGLLDLPGGGREGDESPAACALRELAEEFGIVIEINRIHYHRSYVSADGQTIAHFLAIHLTLAEVAAVKFGDEGEDWRLMRAQAFISDPSAIPQLQLRLADYLATDPKRLVS